MLVILLEALAVLALFLFIVWWTMFSGRKKGELPEQNEERRDAFTRGSDDSSDDTRH